MFDGSTTTTSGANGVPVYVIDTVGIIPPTLVDELIALVIAVAKGVDIDITYLLSVCLL